MIAMPTDENPATLLQGDVLANLRRLPDSCVHCCVTSPPYWALRDYGVSGQIGLEETPEAFIAKLVDVFREVRRVLHPSGICAVNMGDSYSTGVNSKPLDFLNRSLKGSPLFFGDAMTIRVSAKGSHVSLKDSVFPDGVFFDLLGIKRVTIKQRDNDFCQVFNCFASPGRCWISAPVSFASMRGSDIEIVLDSGYDANVIISKRDADAEPEFSVPVSVGRSAKRGKAALSVEEPRKPISEFIRDGESVGNPVSFNSALKRLPDVNFVNHAVSFKDCSSFASGHGSDFNITEASQEQITLGCKEGGISLTAIDVGHLSVLNEFGSVIRYRQLYTEAIRKSNAMCAKQEIGIPDLLKRALMEDGWICRSTLLWAKRSVMPESVTDRPAKALEYVFMLSKKSNYFFDMEAVRKPAIKGAAGSTFTGGKTGVNGMGRTSQTEREDSDGRNFRNADLWFQSIESPHGLCGIGDELIGLDVTSQGYAEAHFATFPMKLVEPFILAGTSAKGVCPECLAPWNRAVEKDRKATRPAEKSKVTKLTQSHAVRKNIDPEINWRNSTLSSQVGNRDPQRHCTTTQTTGWQPTCKCPAHEPIPARVLEPFLGSGTTLAVAIQHGRHGIGIELNPDYMELAKKRLAEPVGVGGLFGPDAIAVQPVTADLFT